MVEVDHCGNDKMEQLKSEPSQDQLKLFLQDSQAMNQTLLNLIPFPITVNRIEDSCFMLVNQKWCEMTGYHYDEVIGQTSFELGLGIQPEYRAQMIEIFQQVGRLEGIEVRIKIKTGGYIDVRMSAELISFQGAGCVLTKTTHINQLSLDQKDLRKSERRFHNILDSLKAAYYELDLKGRIKFFNDTLLVGTFGRKREELMGMSYKQYMLPEDIPRVRQVFIDVYEGKSEVGNVEYGVKRADGQIRYVEASTSLLKDEAGISVGFYGIVRDRTEQKVAEEALRRSEEKHRRILQEMEEGYYEIDLRGNFTAFNDSTVKIHGYSTDELMGMNHKQYLTHEQLQKSIKLFNNLLKTGKSIKIRDYEIIRKDGSICFTEVSGYPLRNDEEKIIGFWGITRDRTEQKIAQKALQKSEEQYRLLVNNANDAIYITQNGRIKFHNPKMNAMTGHSEAELQEMVFADLLHPEDKEHVYNEKQKGIFDGKTPEVFSFRMFNQKKAVLWVELSAINIIWEGQPATLNFLRDVTEYKKTEAKLLQAQKMEAIGTLAGGIAHDFNNILSAILGFTELVMEDVPPNKMVTDNLNEILIAGGRAKDLVHQILSFARQTDENIKPVNVGLIAREALRLIRSSIPATIDIRQNIVSRSPVMGNSTQFHQIIMNLCTNAAHAMEQFGGVLSVDIVDIQIDEGELKFDLPSGHYVKLTVSDTGCGIASEIIDSIFDPYFTTKGLGEGTGMGLSVVQGIVEKYDGAITVDSELKKGSTFTIYFPIAKRDSEPITALEEDHTTDNVRILLVDDELVIIKMVGQMLERMGHQITTRTSSIEALNLFRSRFNDFDLVITDMTMPNMTGDQLAKEMMRIRPDIPVILCTGYSKQINQELALKMGIRSFIFKPINKKDLAATIRHALGRRN